jgi:hypothetical protein
MILTAFGHYLIEAGRSSLPHALSCVGIQIHGRGETGVTKPLLYDLRTYPTFE